MATFIEFCPEEEQAVHIARYFSKTRGKEDAFLEECEKLIKDKQLLEFLNKLNAEIPILFSDKSGVDKDIEAVFFVLLSIVRKLDHESAQKFTSKFVHTLSSVNAEERSVLRLKILSNIYNIVDQNPADRYEVFLAVLHLARTTRHGDLLLPQFKDIEKRIAEWGITIKQKRELYKAIRDTLKETKKFIEAHKWTTKYLSTFENFDGEQEKATEEALRAALEAIKIPDLYQFDTLLDLFPIKQLEGSHPKVFQLLKIFVGDTLDAFTKFVAENPDVLPSLGLNVEECRSKMRLLSLATLGAAANNSEVSYSLIAKTLQIDEGDVEIWVVNAISESIIDAKMDQLKRIVTISRSLQRIFTRSQWQQLSENLSVWTTNVRLLLKTLSDSKLHSLSTLSQFISDNNNNNAQSQH